MTPDTEALTLISLSTKWLPAARGDGVTSIVGFGFHLPEPAVPLEQLPIDEDARARIPGLGQTHTRIAHIGSSEMAAEAGRAALAATGIAPDDIALVISAPSLIASYGLCIPAVEIRTLLGLSRAQCLNLSQGCIGVLKAMDIADLYLASGRLTGPVMIVTSCKASTLTVAQTHGAFFWGDGAAAVVMDRGMTGAYRFDRYAERSSSTDIGALHIPFGDDAPLLPTAGAADCRAAGHLATVFASSTDRRRYIRGERDRFQAVLADLGGDGLSALCLPSTGQDRIPTLFAGMAEPGARLATDSTQPHMGAVDIVLAADRLSRECLPSGDRLCKGAAVGLLSPAFAAQWGGVRLIRQ